MKDEKTEKKHISRRDALKKGGKYAAFTSATIFLVLSPKAQAQESPNQESPSAPEEW